MLELPALVIGLEFAARRVPSAALSAGDIERMLDEGSPWRALTLDFLEVLANPLVGIVPPTRVQAIREGSSRLDRAQDFVAIAGLFLEYAPALTGSFQSDGVPATLRTVRRRERSRMEKSVEVSLEARRARPSVAWGVRERQRSTPARERRIVLEIKPNLVRLP